jgi:hypothetical protein
VVLSLFLFADLLDDALFIFFGDGNIIVCVVETPGIGIGFVFSIRYNIYAIFAKDFAKKLNKIEKNLKNLALNILEHT